MFVHGDLSHLFFNIMNQTILGIPMEYISSWWRVSAVYLSGVLSGGLAASIIKPQVGLCGASTGGYALFAASVFRMHNIMRWREMDKKQKMSEVKNFLVYFLIFELPVFTTGKEISHSGHAFGALGGFLAGILFLENVDVRDSHLEKKIKIAAGCAFAILVGVPIMIHVSCSPYFA
jgi:membrane associated rhomboid family serine protease